MFLCSATVFLKLRQGVPIWPCKCTSRAGISDKDHQTTANIYTHVRDEMLKKATVNMNEVLQQRTED